MTKKKFYIKERHNPQTGIYYVTQGQKTKKEANSIENGAIYGRNVMLAYDTYEDYKTAIADLMAAGERVHEGFQVNQ